MKPYSKDLRDKVLDAYDRKEGSQRALAARFGIALSTVQGWLRRRRETGAAEPRTAPGAAPKLDAAGRAELRAIIDAHSDGALAEWADALCDRIGIRLHESTVWRYAGRLGLTRKKRRGEPRSAFATT
jgi:transposase